MPAGRPPKFSDAQKEQIIDDVCLGLSGSDSSLSEVLIDLDSIICERTFYEWCSSNPKFAQKSARAREMGELQFQPMWGVIADQLDEIRRKGNAMIRGRALTRDQVLSELNRQQQRRANIANG